MSFFSSAKAKLAASKLAEEQLYVEAAEEVASGQIRHDVTLNHLVMKRSKRIEF